MRHEDRDIGIGRLAFGRQGVGQRQPGRQRHHAGQPPGVSQARLQRDRPALRESGQHDALRGDAALALARHQRLQQRLRRPDARFVLAPAAQLDDVEPRAHRHAHVDRHRAQRRVREHEAHREARRQAQRGHYRLEVVAVGT